MRGRDGSPAHLHWTLFSQTLACPHCARPSTVWDDGTDQERGAVAAEWPCKGCGRTIARRGAKALGSVPAVVSLTDEWGRYEAVQTQRRNLLTPAGFDAETQQVLYTVPDIFGRRTALGPSLLLQFSSQIGFRYYF